MKIASIDRTIEAPIIATEFVTDPAAPASGPGAGANAGLRSWAEAMAAAKAKTKKKKNFIAEDEDAIVKLRNIIENFEDEKSGKLVMLGMKVAEEYLLKKISLEMQVGPI